MSLEKPVFHRDRSRGIMQYETYYKQLDLYYQFSHRMQKVIDEEWLDAEREKTDSFREMILQPQSEIEKFRQFLRENGYGILDEEMIEEDGKFYQVIRASGKDELSMEPDCGGARGAAGNGKGHCGMEETVDTAEIPVISQVELCKLKDRYGPVLLRKRTPVFLSFLEREAAVYEEILANLRKQGLTEEKRRERYAEVERLLRDNCLAKSVGKVVK